MTVPSLTLAGAWPVPVVGTLWLCVGLLTDKRRAASCLRAGSGVPVEGAVTVRVIESVLVSGTSVTVAVSVATGATKMATRKRASRYRKRPLPSPTRKRRCCRGLHCCAWRCTEDGGNGVVWERSPGVGMGVVLTAYPLFSPVSPAAGAPTASTGPLAPA